MATLAAGDTTTQLALYIAANAAGADVNSKLQAAVATSLVVANTGDINPLLKQFIAR